MTENTRQIMNGPYVSPYGHLLSDPALLKLFSAQKQFLFYRDFESALTDALGKVGLVDPQMARNASSKIAEFEPDGESLSGATMSDGLPVPDYVRQLKVFAGPQLAAVIHIGATSQDLIDTATALAIRGANDCLAERLRQVIAALFQLTKKLGKNTMMGRTRMQAALPISVAHRLCTWIDPLQALDEDLKILRPRVECLQLGGPVGNRAGWGDKAEELAVLMALALGLTNPPCAWHSARGNIADYANWLSRVTGCLGKMGQDMALMAQQGVDEIAFAGGGGSSAMPHKQNPVLAEILVTLARYNATQLSGMHHALVHEQERSGAAWALEWMILPQMVSATGAALSHGLKLAGSVQRTGTSS